MDERDSCLREMMRMIGSKSVFHMFEACALETEATILQKRAKQKRVTLSRDVALYLARNFQSNADALEEALRRLIAFSLLTGTEMTLPYTQQLLKTFVDSQEHKVPIDSLPELFSECTGRKETKTRHQPWTTADRDSILCVLKTTEGRKVRHQLEVNLRESERQLLARRDAYERTAELHARKRKHNA
ncbi:MAG TPA: DnaA/Hda family protein [Candidatus Sulfotelmatobacter sp.]|nr:DnaA/Hda family protein [Candidatus Sulfotelmatobacter sp.]